MGLGGNDPFIVFDDADIEMAVKGAIASKYRNAGQTCMCANRILMQDGVYDSFTKRLSESAEAMKVADGFEPGAVIGPLIDVKAVEKVEARIADAVKKKGGDRWQPQRWAPLMRADGERQRGSSRNVVGRISARTIDCA